MSKLQKRHILGQLTLNCRKNCIFIKVRQQKKIYFLNIEKYVDLMIIIV